MGNIFLYGQTAEKTITDLFAKLTVYCLANKTVRVKSVDSPVIFDVKSNLNGEAVFSRITPGYWDVTLVDFENAPVKRIKIDSLEHSISIDEFVSTINITYPVGSRCTISHGDKTYKAPDTSGRWVCNVYNSGEWTISSVSGDLSTSKTVTLNSNKQTVNVTLKYFESVINITYPAGSICTVSNGSKTYTSPDTSGTWFCTLNYPGTWIVSCSNGSDSTSTAVTLVYDGQIIYTTLSYFIATINITYAKGSVCTCSYGDIIYTAPDTSGSWSCNVLCPGTWLITSADSNISRSETVTIVEDEQVVEVDLKFEAYISVTYPDGAKCTCSHVETGTVFTADTDINYTFIVPYEGTWKVACWSTDTNMQEMDVQITEDEQHENLEITFTLYLYDNGNEYESLTGGWSATNIRYSTSNGSARVPNLTTSDVLSISLTSNYSTYRGSVAPNNNYFDLSDYSELVVETTNTTSGNVRIILTTSNSNGYNSSSLAYLALQNKSAGTYRLDVTGINQSCYLFISVEATNSNRTASTKIGKIYFV